jgi:hypothetical protein
VKRVEKWVVKKDDLTVVPMADSMVVDSAVVMAGWMVALLAACWVGL